MLINKKLSLLMKKEKPLNIILDNAKIHKAKIVEEACEILSVKPCLFTSILSVFKPYRRHMERYKERNI